MLRLIDVLLDTFSKHRLMHLLGEGNEAKFGADARPGVGHLGLGLGLKGRLLKLSHMCQPFAQSVFDLLEENGLELCQIAVSIAFSAAGITGP